jgi:hypothetical protein
MSGVLVVDGTGITSGAAEVLTGVCHTLGTAGARAHDQWQLRVQWWYAPPGYREQLLAAGRAKGYPVCVLLSLL